MQRISNTNLQYSSVTFTVQFDYRSSLVDGFQDDFIDKVVVTYFFDHAAYFLAKWLSNLQYRRHLHGKRKYSSDNWGINSETSKQELE